MSNFQKSFVKILKTAVSNTANMSKRAMKFRPSRVRPAPKQPFSLQTRHESVEELVTPIKSDSDKKLYKVIKLKNGLTALLISDPSRPPQAASGSPSPSASEDESSGGSTDDTESDASEASVASDGAPPRKHDFDEEKQAACALCVGVGSYSDPPDIQGLAHFVEHMVFMGSEKYPKENDFDSFIKKKGGSDNAATDCETTTFYLEIEEKYLLQALDKFSQFFVKPLMLKEAMQREREAIESEFAMAQPSDTNRRDQLLCSLFPRGHPARTFTWGNLRSLKEMVNDEELHRAAHRFRERHYSAHRMTFTVQARLNLTTLERYTVDTFGQIPTNGLPPDDFSPYNYSAHLVTPDFSSMYYLKPLSDITEVHLTWCVRSLMSEYDSKPHQYISYLLGHEGAGSLLSYLKKRVWALGIYTGNTESGIDYTSMYSLFSVQLVLTRDGLRHVDEVVEAVFSYLNMLRKHGPSERLFNEMKSIEENTFRFEEETQAAEYVENMAENMHLYPPQHFITGSKLYYTYDPQGITDLLGTMTAEAVNVMVLSNKHDPPVTYDRKEEWFGTEYMKRDIPADWTRRWSAAVPHPSLRLPGENVYITTDFDLIPPPQEYLDVAAALDFDLIGASGKELMGASGEERLSVTLKDMEYETEVKNFKLGEPNLLRKSSLMEVWYKPDFKFRLPTALLYFYFITPLSLKSPRDACLLDLWADVLQQGLKEAVYPADLAALSNSFYVGDKGLVLKINGYSQKLHLLVDVITREMSVSGENLTDSLFEAMRDVRTRAYHNSLIKPAKLAKDLRMQLLLNPYVSLRGKAEEVRSVTREELQDFHSSLLKHLYMQVLVQGNLPWHSALRISDKVYQNIQFKPLHEKQMPEFRVHEVAHGDRKCRVSSFNLENTNSIITNYYQSGPQNPKETAILEVLMMLMEEPLFDRLRTKEQLGYSVFNVMRYTFGILGYSVTVTAQADKYTAAHVDSRIEAFLKRFSRDLRRLPERSFEATRRSLAQLKHAADVELCEEVERNWREISSTEYMFGRPYAEAEAIEQLKLSEVREWFERHSLAGNKTNFRKLSVQVVGHKPSEDDASKLSSESLPSYELQYLGAEDISGDGKESPGSFIHDIDKYRHSLKLYPARIVKLPEC